MCARRSPSNGRNFSLFFPALHRQPNRLISISTIVQLLARTTGRRRPLQPRYKGLFRPRTRSQSARRRASQLAHQLCPELQHPPLLQRPLSRPGSIPLPIRLFPGPGSQRHLGESSALRRVPVAAPGDQLLVPLPTHCYNRHGLPSVPVRIY